MRFKSYLPIAALSGGFLLIPVLAQSGSLHVASGQREILLQTTQSWNGQTVRSLSEWAATINDD
jgi:hypothetical protein